MTTASTTRFRPNPFPTRRGAAKGCLIAGAAGIGLLLILGLVAMGKYNSLATGKQTVEQRWAAVDNQYKRRYDLIPNLVETVKGAADFEKSTLEAVTEARASVGRAQLPATLPTDPAQLQAYMEAQQSLGGALSRLLVVAESYPQLKTSQNFLSLQDQIEGTENRIGAAREEYTLAVAKYNTSTKTFPGNIVAGIFGFEPVPQLQITAEERSVPKVDFGTSDEKK